MRRCGGLGTWTLAACVSACSPAAPEAEMVIRAVGPSTTRTLVVTVMGPSQLAKGRSFLASESDGPLITRGGQFLGSGAVTPGGAGYRLNQDGPRFLRVEQASVQVQTLAGRPWTPTVFTDGTGVVAIPIAKNTEPLAVLAAFHVAGRVYRQAAPLPVDAPGGAYMVDPVTTLIDAVVRKDLRSQAASPSYDRFKAVWTALDVAGVSVEPDDLMAEKPAAAAQAQLREVYRSAVDNQLLTERAKRDVSLFQADLERR